MCCNDFPGKKFAKAYNSHIHDKRFLPPHTPPTRSSEKFKVLSGSDIMAQKSNNNESLIFDNWGDYMNAKKSKLQEQFMFEVNKTDVKENIFQGTSIFVNGYTVPTADELRFLMMEYGGIYHHYYTNGKTNYMIASNLPNIKVKQYKSSNMKIIKPTWVTDSIEAGRMLDYKPYLLLTDLRTDGSKSAFMKDCVPVPVSEIFQSSRSTKKNEDNFTKSKIPAKTANDENFLEEFYSNSRLHHISIQGATFKQYINELRSKDIKEFPGKKRLLERKIGHRLPESSLSESETCIMHIDMDCFFVSVCLKKFPHLRSHPVVVTHAKGNKTRSNNAEARKAEFSLYEKQKKEKYANIDEESTSTGRSYFEDIGDFDSMAEIASCSYEARKLGIKNGMLLGKAFKLCPHLKTISYDFEAYKEVSYALYNHIASYTLDIEAVSCDEMYVDCTGLLTYVNMDALEFATFLRKEIKEITGCSCSTGFGPNKLLARLATKRAKPDGQFKILSKEARQFIQEFDVSDLPGIGQSITSKLTSMGVKTCKDLQNVSAAQLQKEFGLKFGLTLHKHSFGEDERTLNFYHQRKSVSADVNYGIRFENSLDAEKFLKKLSAEVENRLNTIGCCGKSITLKLMVKAEEAPTETAKFLGHGICNYVTKTVSLLEPTSDTNVIYREVMKIIQNIKIKPQDFRGIGIQISRLENKKNTSGVSGKIDKFVIKSRKPENDKQVECTPEKKESSRCSDDTSIEEIMNLRVFDESEYNVSFSQIDPNYLEALPEDIREEVIQEAKKRKKIKFDKDVALVIDENTPSLSFIIDESNSPKLNLLAPSTEIVKAIAAWISMEKVPQNCDIEILSNYLRELILKQEFECVNFVIDSFQRLLNNNNNCDRILWQAVVMKLKKVIMETVRFKC